MADENGQQNNGYTGPGKWEIAGNIAGGVLAMALAPESFGASLALSIPLSAGLGWLGKKIDNLPKSNECKPILQRGVGYYLPAGCPPQQEQCNKSDN